MTIPQHDQAQRVTDVCADAAEVLALSIVRFLAAGYATGDVACWDAAFRGAEESLGVERGGYLVASLMGLVRALRAERIGSWTFMPANCCRLTDDEMSIVRLIKVARAGDSPSAGEAAATLARRSSAPAIERAARGAGAIVDEIGTALLLDEVGRARSPRSVH